MEGNTLSVNIMTDLINAIETKILTLTDLTDATVVKYVFHLNNMQKGKYVVGIIPTKIIPDVITSFSSYPEFHVNVILAYIKETENVQEAYITLMEKLNTIYQAFHLKKLGNLNSTAIGVVDFDRNIPDINLGIPYATIELEFKRYTSEV